MAWVCELLNEIGQLLNGMKRDGLLSSAINNKWINEKQVNEVSWLELFHLWVMAGAQPSAQPNYFQRFQQSFQFVVFALPFLCPGEDSQLINLLFNKIMERLLRERRIVSCAIHECKEWMELRLRTMSLLKSWLSNERQLVGWNEASNGNSTNGAERTSRARGSGMAKAVQWMESILIDGMKLNGR